MRVERFQPEAGTIRMTKRRFQRIGVVANLRKSEALEILRRLVPDLETNGFDVFLDDELKDHLTDAKKPGRVFGIPPDVDLIAAVGGDGTILRFARLFAEREIPILGVKGGSLGFLTEGRVTNVVQLLREDSLQIQQRMRIEGAVKSDGGILHKFNALNEIVVHGAGFSRMITLHIQIDGKPLRDYSADGMIIATPTGSTAYSLSAGGPLLEPTVQAIVLTPLSPHTLSFRPIVLDKHQRVSVWVSSGPSDIMITVDGQEGSRLRAGEYLVVNRSEKFTPLVVPDDYNFFALLNEKL